MAATATIPTPPAKLSPSERLVRKRAAARLRQQRCRARKRQAMLESRRQLEISQTPPKSNEDSGLTQGSNALTIAVATPARPTPLATSRDHHLSRTSGMTTTIGPCATPPRYTPARSGEGDYWSDSSSSSGPIQSVVSFGSQGSFEELQQQRSHNNNNKFERIRHGPPPVVSPSASKHSVEIVRHSEGSSAEPLVAEEEAAVAAMLSLKGAPSPSSPSSTQTKKTTPPPPPPPPRAVLHKRDAKYAKYPSRSNIAPRVAKYGYGSKWEPRHGGERFEYGPPPRPIRVVEYHPIPPPPPPMGAMYRYYPTFESRYERYNYD